MKCPLFSSASPCVGAYMLSHLSASINIAQSQFSLVVACRKPGPFSFDSSDTQRNTHSTAGSESRLHTLGIVNGVIFFRLKPCNRHARKPHSGVTSFSTQLDPPPQILSAGRLTCAIVVSPQGTAPARERGQAASEGAPACQGRRLPFHSVTVIERNAKPLSTAGALSCVAGRRGSYIDMQPGGDDKWFTRITDGAGQGDQKREAITT